MENNGNGVLTDEELDKIIGMCGDRGLSPEESFQVASELNIFRLNQFLFEGVMSGEIDFIIKDDGEVGYRAPHLKPDNDFPDVIGD